MLYAYAHLVALTFLVGVFRGSLRFGDCLKPVDVEQANVPGFRGDEALAAKLAQDAADRLAVRAQTLGQVLVAVTLDGPPAIRFAKEQQLGTPYILVNDAGVDATGKHVVDMSLEEWEDRIKTKQSGFREYYNPFTGEGYGAQNFTWSGLVVDMLNLKEST